MALLQLARWASPHMRGEYAVVSAHVAPPRTAASGVRGQRVGSVLVLGRAVTALVRMPLVRLLLASLSG